MLHELASSSAHGSLVVLCSVPSWSGSNGILRIFCNHALCCVTWTSDKTLQGHYRLSLRNLSWRLFVCFFVGQVGQTNLPWWCRGIISFIHDFESGCERALHITKVLWGDDGWKRRVHLSILCRYQPAALICKILSWKAAIAIDLKKHEETGFKINLILNRNNRQEP